jgi:hypothetical protein
MKIKKIKRCEVCFADKLFTVLNLGKNPLCDDLNKIGSKNENKIYPIHILFCKNCFTAYQKFLIPKKILFPRSYHYRSNLTKDVINGMKDLVASYKKKFDTLNNKLVIDIGCNDGSLLDIFKSNKCKTIGVEPTNAFFDIKKKHFAFNEYFSVSLAKKIKILFGFPDIITFTNVFAHINNLTELINALKQIIGPKTIIIIENHYLGSVLSKNQFDTFYHEHPRTYSLKSFFFISKLLNLKIIGCEFPKRYGGNIRVYLGKNSKFKLSKNVNIVLQKESLFFLKFREMRNNIKIWKFNKKKEIKKLFYKHGRLIAKGFPGRAAILISLLKINEKYLKCTYEKPKSPKIGHYIPGTKIPIISDHLLFRDNSSIPIINLSWHIFKEIKDYLRNNNVKNKIINIVSAVDFKKNIKDGY